MKRLVLLALFFPTVAAAQSATLPDETDLPDDAPANARYADVTHIDFREVGVSGEVVRPSIGWVPEPGSLHWGSMHQVRANFDDEMARSVDFVR